ncbi:MAG: hypothetical protein WBL88_10235, partial [Nitrososphaeraceae archaeon]
VGQSSWMATLCSCKHTATGPGCIIQSQFGAGNHKNFEVVVQETSNLYITLMTIDYCEKFLISAICY